jgi:hypothetical protein
MGQPGEHFAEIAVALRNAASLAAHIKLRDEINCIAIGLFPATVDAIVGERQRHADLIAEACMLFKSMVPIEAEVKAMIARRSAA